MIIKIKITKKEFRMLAAALTTLENETILEGSCFTYQDKKAFDRVTHKIYAACRKKNRL